MAFENVQKTMICQVVNRFCNKHGKMGVSLRKLTSLTQLIDIKGRKLLKTHTGKHSTANVATALYVEIGKDKS